MAPLVPDSSRKVGARSRTTGWSPRESSTATRQGSRGRTCRSISVPGRPCPMCHRRYAVDGTWDTALAVLLAHDEARDRINREMSVDSTVNCAHPHGTSLTPPNLARGELSNYNNLLVEPADNAIGRSLGRLTDKSHALVRPRAVKPGAPAGDRRPHCRARKRDRPPNPSKSRIQRPSGTP